MNQIVVIALLGAAAWMLFQRWGRGRSDAAPPSSEGYVEYKSLIRTNNFSMLTLLKSLLEEAGIRYYSSQSSYLHLGEAQLFVERDRFEHAEAILERLDNSNSEETS